MLGDPGFGPGPLYFFARFNWNQVEKPRCLRLRADCEYHLTIGEIMKTKEATIGALLDELVDVSMRREFYNHYGTHADGNQFSLAEFDDEIKRVKREIKSRISSKLAEARHSDHLEHCECV